MTNRCVREILAGEKVTYYISLYFTYYVSLMFMNLIKGPKKTFLLICLLISVFFVNLFVFF